MPVLLRCYSAFAGLFTAAKELRRAPSFEVELDIGSSCCLLQSVAKPGIATEARVDEMETPRSGTFRGTEAPNRYLEMLVANL